MNNKHIRFLIFSLMGLQAFSAMAQTAPPYLPMQALITDASDNPLTNQLITLTVGIEDGGSCLLYEETFPSITTDGKAMISVAIGHGTTPQFAPGLSTFEQIFLNSGLTVTCLNTGTATLNGADATRQVLFTTTGSFAGVIAATLQSVPYAFNSDYVGGVSASQLIQTDTFVTQGNLDILTGGPSVDASGLHNHDSHNDGRYARLGSSNSFTGGLSTSGNISTTGDLGIGTTNPQAGLDIEESTPTLRIGGTGSSGNTTSLQFYGGNGSLNTASIQSLDNSNIMSFYTGSSLAMTLDSSQNAEFSKSVTITGTLGLGQYMTGNSPGQEGSWPTPAGGTLLSALAALPLPFQGTIWENSTSHVLKYWDGAQPITLGTVTTVTASGPMVSSAGNTPNISMSQATAAQGGWLSSSDWSTFNLKQTALGYTPLNNAGDTMMGTLNLPTDGLIAGINQLVLNGGKVGIGTAIPNAQLQVTPTAPTSMGLLVQETVGQSANLTQWENSAGTVLSYVDSAGSFHGNGAGLTGIAVAGTLSGLTTGGVLFATASNTAGEDSSNYFYDSAHHALGLGTQSPAIDGNRLDVEWIAGEGGPTAFFGSNNFSDGADAIHVVTGTGIGVKAVSQTNVGVEGVTSSASFTSAGVYGLSNNSAPAVLGQSFAGPSGYFQSLSGSNTNPTLVVQQDSISTADLFQAENAGGLPLFKISSNGNVGIGTSAPTNNLTVAGANTQTSLAVFNVSSTSAEFPNVEVGDFTGGNSGEPLFELLASRGNQSSPAAIMSGDPLGMIASFGQTGTSMGQTGMGANISFLADSNFSTSAFPTDIIFSTTNATAPAERMRISASGGVGIGGVTNPSAALEVSGNIKMDNGSGSVFFAAPAGSNTLWTYPPNSGISGNVLTTDGSGDLSWSSVMTSLPSANGSTNGYLAATDWTNFNNKLSATGGAMSGTLTLPGGSAGAPSLNFIGNPQTGLFSPVANSISLTTNGQPSLTVGPTGNVGIGTPNPTAALHIQYNSSSNSALELANTMGGGQVYWIGEDPSGFGTLEIYDSTSGLTPLAISSNGNVGIGTTFPNSLLNISGNQSSSLLNSINLNSSGGAIAVSGTTTNATNIGIGVSGTGGMYGVQGIVNVGGAADAGVFGENSGGGQGVWGQATSGIGVKAQSASGTSGYFETNGPNNSNPTVVIQAGSVQTGNLLQLENTSGTPVLSIGTTGHLGIGISNAAVSLDLSGQTDAVALPAGTTAQEPAAPSPGMIRYNTVTPGVEYYSGASWTTVGKLPTRQILLTSGTYTTPPGARQLRLRMVGGGGGGGGASGYCGASGGSGEYAEVIINAPVASYPYNIGIGGTPGSAGVTGTLNGGNGGAGGSTWFSAAASYSALGGGGGGGGPYTGTPAPSGGAGGSGGVPGAQLHAPGATGSNICSLANAPVLGNYGSGGGVQSNNTAGLAGGVGIIIVDEYY